MKSKLELLLKRMLWRTGWDLVRFSPSTHPLARRARLMKNYGIDLVLDVGANIGQYAAELRQLGYRGKIVSFEPLADAYGKLAAAAHNDALWETRGHALGSENVGGSIHVAGNSQSSSFLPMLPAHVTAFPGSGYVNSESVEIKRLDSIFEQVTRAGDRVWLKIDTQGFEASVIEGATRVLSQIEAIQAEVSLHPLYDGELTLAEFIPFVERKGFSLVALETYLGDAVTSHLLQVECIFRRSA